MTISKNNRSHDPKATLYILSFKETGIFAGVGIALCLLGLKLPYPRLTLLGIIFVLIAAFHFVFRVFHIQNRDMSSPEGGIGTLPRIIILALGLGVLLWIFFGPRT
jgi:hypothetical protein